MTLLGRFPQIDGVFAINDLSASGIAAAATKLNRVNFPTAVDGTPDAVQALKDPNLPRLVGRSTSARRPLDVDPAQLSRTLKRFASAGLLEERKAPENRECPPERAFPLSSPNHANRPSSWRGLCNPLIIAASAKQALR